MVPPRLEYLHVTIADAISSTHCLSYYGSLELLERAYKNDPPVRITLDSYSAVGVQNERTQFRGALAH